MNTYEKNILAFSAQLSKEGLNPQNLSKLKSIKADGVIIAGMGGSGLAGEVLLAHQKEVKLKVPAFLWKEYGLPDASLWGLKHPLYVFTSFSGNTEETVSGLKAAMSKARVAVIGTGGELLKIAEKNNLPYVEFPAEDLTPRQATGRMFYSLMEILEAGSLIPRYNAVATNLRPADFKQRAAQLARKLKGQLVTVYADYAHRDIGYLWKIKLNETGKTQAFLNILPEMNHNEIVSFEAPETKTTALFLIGNEHPRLVKKAQITAKLIKGKKSRVIELPVGDSLRNTWEMIVWADWTSYFLAKLKKKDPTEVKIIEDLKNLMKK